jgi:hypothetical protein
MIHDGQLYCGFYATVQIKILKLSTEANAELFVAKGKNIKTACDSVQNHMCFRTKYTDSFSPQHAILR